jgi:diguanylate cyclase (GGDEF)-like protein/PAS domain S-box-containing protein
VADPAFDLFVEDDETAHAAELTQRTLIDTQERMGMMLDLMPMGLLIHTRQGIIFANQEACRQLHISQKQAIGHHFLDFIDATEVSAVADQINQSFADESNLQTRETRLSHPGGDLYIKLISCRLPWQGNPVVQILLQDVTDLKRTEQKLRHMAITDELTGAFNRRHAFHEGTIHADRDRNHDAPLSAILLDVDHFKKVNDTHGHQLGDRALVALATIAERIIKSMRRSDAMFARLGGEEFLVLLPGVDAAKARDIAERIRKAIASHEVAPDKQLRITVSMGVGTLQDADRSFEDLLSRCDDALYAAKGAGRNRVEVAK